MCGEIEKWQYKRSLAVRLTSNALGQYEVRLSKDFLDAQAVWLDEYMFTNFNGGVSGHTYMQLEIQNMSSSCFGNEGVPGVCLPVDVLNPNVILQRPREILQASGNANFSRITVKFFTASGTPITLAPTTFNEAVFVFTVVMRKSPELLLEYRRLKQSMLETPPSKGPDPRNSWQPSGNDTSWYPSINILH